MAQPNISTELLRTFLAVVERDGFIRAAESLHKTQSTVSQQIKKLELELGVVLFRPNGRKRLLTHEGEMLVGYARKMLALQDDAIASLASSGELGEIKVGVSQGVAETVLPELLAGFSRKNPAVRLFVETGYSDELELGYERGDYDLIVTLSLSSSGKGEVLGGEPLAWIGPVGFSWSPGRELPMASYSKACQFRRVSIESLDQSGIPWRLVYTSSSYQGLMAAVKCGLGVTVRPRSAVLPGVELIGGRLGLPELPMIYTSLRYRRDINVANELAETFRLASLGVR
ncbi:LysR substrate-binding domain-containing protein [Neptuniibacter sp. QD37_6]|uniref:LysR substrate-binding domain-containing protein n=1 Tax=Neptuniibacter sp. QD37_6 TaxID=3398210 RepID=UPI0039F613CE